MGKRSIDHHHHHVSAPKSQTLPPFPSHSSSSSSSSSDFEFTISASPRKASSVVCPADELFYKGKVLPLHVSPRVSMVRTLLLASSSDGTGTSTTASRDSTGSSNDSFDAELDSSRRASSAAEDEELRRTNNSAPRGSHKYFPLARLFKKEPDRQLHRHQSPGCGAASHAHAAPRPSSSVRRMSAAAKEAITKCLKKVKPLYEKMSQRQKLGRLLTVPASSATTTMATMTSVKGPKKEVNGGRSGGFSHSFSGNLLRRKSSISSCPSSTRSSPSHSGVLSAGKGITYNNVEQTTSSSMDELQSAIQGAIAHCKNSLVAHNNN